jgi:excisionase family DNA binding protein
MTTKEAAAALGVQPQTISRAINRKMLKATKRGRDWWIGPKDLEQYRAGWTGGRRKQIDKGQGRS